MMQPNPIVFLVDVNDSLLENDRIQDDIRRYVERESGRLRLPRLTADR